MSGFVLTKSTNYPAGVKGLLNGSDSVGVYDSGTILGTTPPGGTGKKLIDGTQQSATTAASDSTAGVNGNFFGPSQDASGNLVQNTSYQGQSLGYSIAPQFE